MFYKTYLGPGFSKLNPYEIRIFVRPYDNNCNSNSKGYSSAKRKVAEYDPIMSWIQYVRILFI